jgi:hypothetical protein
VLEMLESHNDIEIDLFDKQILFICRTKMKDILNTSISINAIEARKQNLKELLKATEGTDIDLVREALEK